jgi:hypothetical protein
MVLPGNVNWPLPSNPGAISFSHKEQFPGTHLLNHEDGTSRTVRPQCNPKLGNGYVPQPWGISHLAVALLDCIRRLFPEKLHQLRRRIADL